MPTNSPRFARVRVKLTGEIVDIFEDDFRRDRHESLPPEASEPVEASTPKAPAKKAAPARTPEITTTKEL